MDLFIHVSHHAAPLGLIGTGFVFLLLIVFVVWRERRMSRFRVSTYGDSISRAASASNRHNSIHT